MLQPKKLCQRCGDPATWYSNISGEDLCTPHYDAVTETVSPSRPMRPWKWDAVAFKATQSLTVNESLSRLSVLQQHAMAQAGTDSLRAMANDPNRFYRMQPRPASGGFWSQVFGIF